MEYVRRIYVAGVGYTCYLTESVGSSDGLNDLGITKAVHTDISKKESLKEVKKEISIAKYTTFVQTKNLVKEADINYALNLKIGYSDLKTINLTKYITDKNDPLEILVVGKEILTTPGYQEILLESEPSLQNQGAVISPIRSIIIIRGNNKNKVNSLAALIRNYRPYSVYKGIGLRLQGEPLNIKVVVKNKQKS